jgi:hypothetical protein
MPHALTPCPPEFVHPRSSSVLQIVSILCSPERHPFNIKSKETWQDLHRAIKELVTNTDERIIFDPTPPHSQPQAWHKLLTESWSLSEEAQNDIFTPGEILQIHEQEDEYYRNLKTQIESFLATEDGAQVGQELSAELLKHLLNPTPYFNFDLIPDDLYSRVVAVELDQRKRFRHEHGLEEERTFPFQIVRALGPDNQVHETITHWIGFSASYADMLESLRNATKNWQAKEWGYEKGFGEEKGERWFYQTPQSPVLDDRNKMKSFNEGVFYQMKDLFLQAPDRGIPELKVLFWHVSLHLTSTFLL